MTNNIDNCSLAFKISDSDDMNIFSCTFQDSILPVIAMVHEKKTFSILANRFCWEYSNHLIDDKQYFFRVHSGIVIKNVKKVMHKGFKRHESEKLLNLLMIDHMENDPNAIKLIFSDNHEIILHTEKVEIYVKDFHDPWMTEQKPNHQILD
jgi:hypothetical protein